MRPKRIHEPKYSERGEGEKDKEKKEGRKRIKNNKHMERKTPTNHNRLVSLYPTD